MLLTRKTIFSVCEAQIKEDVFSDDKSLLLKINLKYPNIRCNKNDPLNSFAVPFYKKLADGFWHFAKSELPLSAKESYTISRDTFLPFAAVMKYEVTAENAEYLSIMTDISISDGKSIPSTERKTQVWDRKSGLLCRYTDFITAEKTKELQKKKLSKYDLFVLRNDKIEIFLRDGDGYRSFYENIENAR